MAEGSRQAAGAEEVTHGAPMYSEFFLILYLGSYCTRGESDRVPATRFGRVAPGSQLHRAQACVHFVEICQDTLQSSHVRKGKVPSLSMLVMLTPLCWPRSLEEAYCLLVA